MTGRKFSVFVRKCLPFDEKISLNFEIRFAIFLCFEVKTTDVKIAFYYVEVLRYAAQ